jgi:hypothetical protein
MTLPALASGELAPATFLQRGLWPRLRNAAPGESFAARAVRFTGQVQPGRLHAAIRTVYAALPALDIRLIDTGTVLALGRHGRLDVREHDLRHTDPAAREAACLAVLREDLEHPAPGGALTRFHVIRLADDELVLGLVSHQLVLDERSLYLVLGAVLQAYQERFRRSTYRDFTEMLDFYPLSPAVAASRRTWWSAWLARCPDPVAGAPAVREAETSRLIISGADWRALADAGGTMRDNGSLGIAALVAWWLSGVAGAPVPALATVLDLRDYCELGQVVGPLTDRIAFRVELAADPAPSFRQLFRKTQVGVLRSTTRYLPYGDVIDVGTALGRITPPRTAALWDVDVHLCANPPGSGRSRGHEHGISAGVFRAAELLTPQARADAGSWDGTNVDVRMSECDGGIAVIIDVNRRHWRYAAAGLADRLGEVIAAAVTDPEAPLNHRV